MYVPIGFCSPGYFAELTRDVPWNPPGWGSAVVQQTVITARLSQLIGIRPGGHIPIHCDDPATENAMEPGLTRVHLVLESNRHCWSFHDGTWQQLEVGRIYQMDPTKEHASINLGDTVRFHLVLEVAGVQFA